MNFTWFGRNDLLGSPCLVLLWVFLLRKLHIRCPCCLELFFLGSREVQNRLSRSCVVLLSAVRDYWFVYYFIDNTFIIIDFFYRGSYLFLFNDLYFRDRFVGIKIFSSNVFILVLFNFLNRNISFTGCNISWLLFLAGRGSRWLLGSAFLILV